MQATKKKIDSDAYYENDGDATYIDHARRLLTQIYYRQNMYAGGGGQTLLGTQSFRASPCDVRVYSPNPFAAFHVCPPAVGCSFRR